MKTCPLKQQRNLCNVGMYIVKQHVSMSFKSLRMIRLIRYQAAVSVRKWLCPADQREHVSFPLNLAGRPFFLFVLRIVFAASLISSIWWVVPSYAEAGAEIAGKLSIVKGGVTVKRPGLDKVLTVRTGTELLVGDVLTTGAGAQAQLVLLDSAFINIAPDASLRVNQYSLSPDTRLPDINRRTSVIKVMRGKARFIAYKQMSQDSSITVETEHASATAAGVTDFVVNAAPDMTEVLALANWVRVKNVSYLVVGAVSIEKSLMTQVRAQNPPSKPSVLTPQSRDAYIKEVRQIR